MDFFNATPYYLAKIFTYQQKDKLKSRKQTQNLFSFGKSMTNAPLRLIYTLEQMTMPEDSNAMDLILQAGVGAPSRQFRKAFQRNRVKRLLREAYRLAKPAFKAQLPLKGMRLNLFVLYMDTNVLPQADINEKMEQILNQLIKRIYGQA